MTLNLALIALVALAVLLGVARLVFWQHRAPPEARSRGWRLALLLLLQPLCGALLYLTLAPPRVSVASGTLVVATRNAPRTAAATVALPEAPALPGAERLPDLATALRLHDSATLRILGDGLEPRDRDAVGGRRILFDPPALPRGLVRFDPTTSVVPGSAFEVGGRVSGVPGGSVELLDPAGRRVDARPLPPSGAFVLNGAARGAGPALFRLRTRDAARKVVSDLDWPVRSAPAPAPRLLLLAGAPGPELKYLRRWATDAGLSVNTQLSTGGGVRLGDAPLPLDAATLRRFDVAVLDERSWSALSVAERNVLASALRDGLGVILRVTGPLSDIVRRQWRALGIDALGNGALTPARLPDDAIDPDARLARQGVGSRDRPVVTDADEQPALGRRSLTLAGREAAPLLRDAAGQPLASWRAVGRGRIALWSLEDSFALVLAGEAGRHAELWSAALAQVARPGAAAPRIEPLAWQGERTTICGLSGPADVVAPDGAITRLLVDPASQGLACAAYWPRAAGLHTLRQATPRAGTWSLVVQPADALPGVRAAERRDATLRLMASRSPPSAIAPSPDARSSLWPWLIAWLASSVALWWLERTRFGRRSS